MTETSGIVGVNVSRPDNSHFGSTGTLVSNMEAKIIDVTTGKALPPYDQGEICVRGPNVMRGLAWFLQHHPVPFILAF